MVDRNELEELYRGAQSALKGRDYDHAAELLRQILRVDEDYKDVSRLLARIVRKKRRRWYNHPVLWSVLGVLVLIGLGYIVAPGIQSSYSNLAPSPTEPAPTIASSPTLQPPTATPTIALAPSPTPIPLAWKRISLGQEFPRDTVSSFAVDRNDPDVIYASMDNAGVYKSIDGGLSWKPAHNGLSNTQVVSLVIDFENPNFLYAGTMNGIYKTEDGGGNWSRIGNGMYLLMDYQDSSHLYARDENGIYESTDQGGNWVTTHPLKGDCPSEIHAWALHPLDGMTLFAGGWGECGPGVFRSDDGGRLWTLLEVKGKTDISLIAIGLGRQEIVSIYIYSNALWPEGGTYESHDDGKSWSKTNFLSTCIALIPDPQDPETVYCASGGVFATKDKGKNLSRLGLNTMALTMIQITHIKDEIRLIAGGTRHRDYTDEGVFISWDGGGTWVRQSNGLASARAELKLDPLDGGKMYLAAYYPYQHNPYETMSSNCSLYRSADGGKNWEEIISVVGWCGPSFDAAGNFYLTDSSALQMTWDGGDHWLWDGPGYTGPYGLPITSQSVSANPFIGELIYAVGEEIYYSEHAGKLWQPAAGSEGLWDAKLFYGDQGRTVYAIGRYLQKYSTDSGKTWQNCGIDVTTSRSDTRLAIASHGSRLFLATPGRGVMLSTDNCQSWQISNEGMGNLFVNTLATDPNNPNTVYAGTDGGAYISFDGGKTWNEINDGLLGATVVYSIVADKDSNVYTATPYGIFKLESK